MHAQKLECIIMCHTHSTFVLSKAGYMYTYNTYSIGQEILIGHCCWSVGVIYVGTDVVHIGTYIRALAPGHMIITHCVYYVKHVDTGTSVSSDLWCACMVSKVTNKRGQDRGQVLVHAEVQ